MLVRSFRQWKLTRIQQCIQVSVQRTSYIFTLTGYWRHLNTPLKQTIGEFMCWGLSSFQRYFTSDFVTFNFLNTLLFGNTYSLSSRVFRFHYMPKTCRPYPLPMTSGNLRWSFRTNLDPKPSHPLWFKSAALSPTYPMPNANQGKWSGRIVKLVQLKRFTRL